MISPNEDNSDFERLRYELNRETLQEEKREEIVRDSEKKWLENAIEPVYKAITNLDYWTDKVQEGIDGSLWEE